MGKKNKALDPDGIWKKLYESMEIMADTWRVCYKKCIRAGKFSDKWKIAKLVLIKKPGKPNDKANSYRPLCLLNECGKLYERIIAKRVPTWYMNYWTRTRDYQKTEKFGFRPGRSSIDAIQKLREITENATCSGKVVIAISLDISNAFNSIPWEVIIKTMERKSISKYLRNVIEDYLNNRWIIYYNDMQEMVIKPMTRGVSQGSVMGPLLWNMTFNSILEADISELCYVICYADDTLVVALRDNLTLVAEATTCAELAVAIVAGHIRRAGLKLAIKKTESLLGIEYLARYRP